MTGRARIRRRSVTAAAVLLATTAALTAVSAAPAGAAGLPPLDPAALRQSISGLPSPGITGALLRITGSAGAWSGASGRADLATGRPVRGDERFRIGSVTKVFTATVVLQLVAEHRVELDRSIQSYLPGVLPRAFPAVTVTQLLDHTSGLPGGAVDDDENDPAGYVTHRFGHPTPAQVLAGVRGKAMSFTPGTEQQYNGINYYLLGMLIERVTGRPYAAEVSRRILRPLRLHATEVPAATDYRLPGPRLHGYWTVPQPGGGSHLVDVTEQSPYPWAEGGMISTARDLGTFLSALLSGRLLPPAETADLTTVPDVPYLGGNQCQAGTPGRACYGMGLERAVIKGVTVWGKTGSRPGYTDGVFSTPDGSRVMVYAFTPTSGSENTLPFIYGIADAAL
jgi:D-alanyl-D-alanine carboxypeptidase